MSSSMQIDGSMGEGGGQVLRIVLSLSALFKIPVKINNIRARRSKPGLATQHLKGVELLKNMCNAELHGAYIGSTDLEFKPGHSHADKTDTFFVDTGTAACICLLVQVALPYVLFLPRRDAVRLILKGGTNSPMGPHVEYLIEVFRPMLNKFGADFDCRVIKKGYYPKGGGEVHLYIKPVHTLKAVTLTDPGMPHKIFGYAYVTGFVSISGAYRIANDVKSTLRKGLNENNISVPPINIEVYKEDKSVATNRTTGINVICTTTSGCIIGGSGMNFVHPEIPPGVQAANEILDTILERSCVDKYMQDQLIILMALAKGMSRINLGKTKLTCHTQTAIEVTEMILSKFGFHFKLCENKDARGDTLYSLECEGCGYENKIVR
ncbi:RNA 3'-terminal phosphate cyclase [Anthophora quadrimaculata]